MNNEMTGAKASATLVTGDRGRRPRLSSRFSGGTLPHSVYRSKCGVGSVSTSVGVFTKTDGGGISKEKKKKNSNHPPDDVDEKVFVIETRFSINICKRMPISWCTNRPTPVVSKLRVGNLRKYLSHGLLEPTMNCCVAIITIGDTRPKVIRRTTTSKCNAAVSRTLRIGDHVATISESFTMCPTKRTPHRF